jgi:enterochelin esterase-like enzyme
MRVVEPRPVLRLVLMRRRADITRAAAVLLFAGAATAGAESVPVRFEVDVPESTPAGAEVWISGNAAALGAWNGRGLRLEAAGDRRYAATLGLEPGTALEFKVTRGGWDTVEKGMNGAELANRAWTVTGPDTIRARVAAWRDQTEGAAAARRSTLSGDIRVHAAFPSAVVRPRTVRVWLPPDYAADTTRRHAVLYFHDGNNVFDAATSFIGVEWGADEAAGRIARAGKAPPFIVVAVDNTPDRMSGYTPVADPRHAGGGAAGYARFLAEELKPFIDRTYSTRTDPAATGVIGSSLAGLVSLWLGLERPDMFG